MKKIIKSFALLLSLSLMLSGFLINTRASEADEEKINNNYIILEETFTYRNSTQVLNAYNEDITEEFFEAMAPLYAEMDEDEFEKIYSEILNVKIINITRELNTYYDLPVSFHSVYFNIGAPNLTSRLNKKFYEIRNTDSGNKGIIPVAHSVVSGSQLHDVTTEARHISNGTLIYVGGSGYSGNVRLSGATYTDSAV